MSLTYELGDGETRYGFLRCPRCRSLVAQSDGVITLPAYPNPTAKARFTCPCCGYFTAEPPVLLLTAAQLDVLCEAAPRAQDYQWSGEAQDG